MKLQHKIFVLVTADGKEAKISDVKNLQIVVNGFPLGLYVVPREKDDINFIQEAGVLDSNILEGYSIFSKFVHDKESGILSNDDVHITFYDEKTNQEYLIKAVAEPPLLMLKVPEEIDLSDEHASDQLQFLKEIGE